MKESLPTLAGRVPQRVRRLVPERLRNTIVDRLGHPIEPFDPGAHPRKVNLGSGFTHIPGYVSVDLQAFHNPDLVADVRKLDALPSAYYEEAIATDVLEHLERADVPVALREWRRVLAPGGVLQLRVPDFPSLAREIAASEDPEVHRGVIHRLFGTQAYTGDYHLTGFTDVVLCDELLSNGFGSIAMGQRDGWLWDGAAVADGAGSVPAALVWASDGQLLVYAREPVEATLVVDLAEPGTLLGNDLDAGRHELQVRVEAGATRGQARLASAEWRR